MTIPQRRFARDAQGTYDPIEYGFGFTPYALGGRFDLARRDRTLSVGLLDARDRLLLPEVEELPGVGSYTPGLFASGLRARPGPDRLPNVTTSVGNVGH